MDDKDKKVILIVVAAVAGLGCCGVTALFGLGMWGASVASSPVVAPMPPAVPTTPMPNAPGWASYPFAANCSGANPNLRLQRLTVAYPTTHTVLPCTEQQPRPWAYVTFHHEGPSGAAVSQWTVGYASGPVDFNLLAQAADDLSRQLNAGATVSVRQDQIQARGAALLRRDSTFTVAAAMGAFVPGTYIYRQVVVPNPNGPDGVMLTYVAPSTNPQADLAANEPDLRRVIDSIVF